MLQSVADRGSNANEQIEHAAKILRRSANCKKVFTAIYTDKRKSKTIADLITATKLNNKQILKEGKKLASNDLVVQTKVNKSTAYEKINFFQHHRETVLRLANNSKALQRFPTKRKPEAAFHVIKVGEVKVEKRMIDARFITIDDIESFSKVKKIKKGSNYQQISEGNFKKGMASILAEKGEFKDWGGELSDLFSTRLVIKGKRRVAAFAFKGPGTKGKLTPGKMGKNGDQIQRLATCPADVFIVQYWAEIDQSVLLQLQRFLELKSFFERRPILYGLIDGDDSTRIIQAYSKAFP